MMVVMTVMAAALHLNETLIDDRARCQIFLLPAGRGGAENGAVQTRIRWAALALGRLGLSLPGPAQYSDRDSSGVPKTSTKAPPAEARVDINHASMEELLKIPGMTPSWAGRIVRYRPYRSKQDLVEHGVVTSQVYERIKDDVIAHRDKR